MKGTRQDGMGTFLYPVRLGRLDGSRWKDTDALVDAGSTYTWIPGGVVLDYDEHGNLVALEILDASLRVTEARRVEFQTVG